jgi:hypothetical protein
MLQPQLCIQRCVQHVLPQPYWEQQDVVQSAAKQAWDHPRRRCSTATVLSKPIVPTARVRVPRPAYVQRVLSTAEPRVHHDVPAERTATNGEPRYSSFRRNQVGAIVPECQAIHPYFLEVELWVTRNHWVISKIIIARTWVMESPVWNINNCLKFKIYSISYNVYMFIK